MARRLLGEQDADDATQEIFIRAWRRLHTYRGTAAFGTWLYRLGLNRLLDLRRRGDAMADRRTDIGSMGRRSAADPSAALDCEAALLRLPVGARQVLVLHDVEGHTHQEIAQLLRIAPGTSKSQLHRARALMRELLADADGRVKS